MMLSIQRKRPNFKFQKEIHEKFSLAWGHTVFKCFQTLLNDTVTLR